MASVFTSVIVTLSVFLALQFLQKDGAETRFPILVAESEVSSLDLQAQIILLKSEIQRLHKRLEGFKHQQEIKATTRDQANSALFDKRIVQIELALDKLSSDAAVSRLKNNHVVPERMSERMDQHREVLTEQRRELVEAQFERDSGLPLGDFSDSIEDVIHQIDGIQAQGIDCRNTICKVTYAAGNELTTESEDADWQLMEQLLERSGGRQVDIRYANDSFGNNTMYIQLD